MARKGVPTTIRGVEYPSRQKAADTFGVSVQALRQSMERGTLDRLGLNPRGRGRGRAVEFDGEVYPSISACAKANNMEYYKMRRYFDGL